MKFVLNLSLDSLVVYQKYGVDFVLPNDVFLLTEVLSGDSVLIPSDHKNELHLLTRCKPYWCG